jgi:predicted esterase
VEQIIYLKVQKTARFIHLKEKEALKDHLLICLHGYAQLAPFFSKKFEALLTKLDVLIPEGLNRFYQKGSSGRVGASWMTKEDRSTDILDNMAYLKQIVDRYIPSYSKISIFGFSQGGATAARYFYLDSRIHQLIVAASDYPTDLQTAEFRMDKRKKHFILGTNDPYFDAQNQKDVLSLYSENNFVVHTFEGEHEVNNPLIEQCLD